MPFVRAGVERLLLLLFGVVQRIFLFQGLAFGSAWLATRVLAPADAPSWLRVAMLFTLLLSATFFAAGLLLIPARRWRPSLASGDPEPAGPWPALLGLSLLALPALAAHAASGLVPLWSEIAAWLEAIDFWDGWLRPEPSGLLMIPLLLALFVPALATAAASFSIAFPLALLPLLATRSRRLPTLLAMGVVCQAALVLGAWLASDALARLAEQAFAAMAAENDAEALGVADELRRATGVLGSTATALFVPSLGMLAWLAFLRPSGAVAAWFTQGASPVPADARREPRTTLPVPPPSLPSRGEPRAEGQSAAMPPPARRAAPRSARRGLVALGALMLAFAAADGLRTRAAYVSSQPAPGATLADPPAAVRVRFAAALDPASALSITRLVVEPAAGREPAEVESSCGLAADDPEHRTLEAVPSQLPIGLYHVTWQALPARGGVPRVGSFSFGVGVPVPSDSASVTHSLQDRDGGARGRRQTWAGGALLLVMGALLPRLSPRGGRR